MKINAIILTGLLLLLATLSAFATPSISSIAGTTGDGEELVITGTGFFNHPNPSNNQNPGWFTDFEDQQIAPIASLSLGTTFDEETANCMSITSADKAEGTYAIRHDLSDECAAFTEGFIRLKGGDGFGFPLSGTIVAIVHRRNTSSEPTSNWKWWRIAHDDDDFYPNTWIGNAPDSGSQAYTEACDFDDPHQNFFSYVKPTSGWMEDGFFAQRESSNYGTNGYLYSRQNGDVTLANTSKAFNCASQDTGSIEYFTIEDDISNDNTTGFSYYDYVYIDTMSTVYVMFTNANTFAGSTKYWVQPYTGMETTEITIQQKFADLGSDPDDIYVYVCQQGDDCSSGVQLSSAGEGGGGEEPSTPSPGKMQMKGKLKLNGRIRT